MEDSLNNNLTNSITLHENGDLVRDKYDAANTVLVAGCGADTVCQMRVEVHLAAKIYDVYINDMNIPVATAQSFMHAAARVSRIISI